MYLPFLILLKVIFDDDDDISILDTLDVRLAPQSKDFKPYVAYFNDNVITALRKVILFLLFLLL